MENEKVGLWGGGAQCSVHLVIVFETFVLTVAASSGSSVNNGCAS